MVTDTVTPVLLYDGECGLCAGTVQFVLRHEPESRRAALRFAPLQGAFAASARVSNPHLHGVDSVVWFDASRHASPDIRMKSDAVFAVLDHTGGAWRLLSIVGRLVPRALRDLVYDAIARRRASLVPAACVLPSPENRARFLA